jgi:hypothetical protein
VSSGPERLLIRPAAAADIGALGRLGAVLVRAHHEFDPQRFIAGGPGTEKGYGSFLGAQLQDPAVTVVVAEREGTVVGYAYAGMEGHDYMALRRLRGHGPLGR